MDTGYPRLFDIQLAFDHSTPQNRRAAFHRIGVAECVCVQDMDGQIVVGIMEDGDPFVDAHPWEQPPKPPPISDTIARLLAITQAQHDNPLARRAEPPIQRRPRGRHGKPRPPAQPSAALTKALTALLDDPSKDTTDAGEGQA
jgi:hypothetical protein